MIKAAFIRAMLLAIALCTTPLAQAEVALLIKNARIVDGTGNPWFRSDVAISEGRFVTLGTNLNLDAREVIDADGMVLAPGFIDIHTHVESSARRSGLSKLPRADNYVLDGVTTMVTGNCGSSATDIGAWAQSLSGLGINVATFVGHNSIRRAVMGRDNRAPTSEELNQMEQLVEQGMRDGAVGFSTGLLYVPGTYAATDEVISLASVAAAHGGLYASHIREQGAKLHDSIIEAISVGAEAQMPVQISHFKVKGPVRWGSIGEALALIDTYRESGIDVTIDAYPYERASTSLAVSLPRWAVAGRAKDVAARIQTPDTRARIIAEMKAMLRESGYPNYGFATVAQFTPDPGLTGKTISEINRLGNREPTVDNEIDTILDMMIAGGAAGHTNGAHMVYHYMSMNDVETIFRYPNTAVASDGNINDFGRGRPHPRSYGTNARVLADFVRKSRLLTLEDAIRRMTSLPARSLGFHHRGIIRSGFVADAVLFDPAEVQDMATFENPHQYTRGFEYVLVNGIPVVAKGSLTDQRPGKFISAERYDGISVPPATPTGNKDHRT